jgi:TrmH family RNA methyltransferase
MPHVITSLQNRRVKEAVRLRDRRGREKQGRFLVDGVRELCRALEGDIEFDEVFWCESACGGDDARAALEAARAGGAKLLGVTAEVFRKLAFGDRSEGLVGVGRTPHRTLIDLEAALPSRPLVTVLEAIEKPGNVGAVVRSADGAGVSAVILADAVTDLYNPNAIRASLGTIFTLPVCSTTTRETLAWLRRRDLQVVATRVDGAVPYTDIDYTRPTAIVLGNETQGLGARWQGEGVTAAALPMRGKADSLNVSATAAVMFYEALRQRVIVATELVNQGVEP